jgi:hypothetical protein
MPKFTLTGTMVISVYTEVEAETLEEAIKEAEQRGNAQIIKDGSFNPEEEWTCDELDGTAQNITQY